MGGKTAELTMNFRTTISLQVYSPGLAWLLTIIFLCGACKRDYGTIKGVLTDTPGIEFTLIPSYGSAINLEGRVSNIGDPACYKVAVYIFVEGAGWWIKPTNSEALISIDSDLTWEADISTGGNDIYATRIRAILLQNDTDPPLVNGSACLPSELSSIADAVVDTIRYPRTISFSGYQWWIKNSIVPVGPGPNLFSEATENVWVDENDNLHLKVTKRGNRWYCPEVVLYNTLGYGKYFFQITGVLDHLNENVVFGLFSWDNDACFEYHREIDIEFSRWGNQQDTTNAQYVIQPYHIPQNLHRWQIPASIDSSTHVIDWQVNTVDFVSLKGHQWTIPNDSVTHAWSYTGLNTPEPGAESIRLNLWLLNGQPPTDNEEVEVIISRFDFIPSSEVHQ